MGLKNAESPLRQWGRRNLSGGQHSAPGHELSAPGGRGSPKARKAWIAEAALARSMAALIPEASAPQSQGTSVKTVTRKIKRERTAAYTIGQVGCSWVTVELRQWCLRRAGAHKWCSSRKHGMQFSIPKCLFVECRVASEYDEATVKAPPARKTKVVPNWRRHHKWHQTLLLREVLFQSPARIVHAMLRAKRFWSA